VQTKVSSPALDILFGPVVVIHDRPVLAFLPALLFALLAWAMRGRARFPFVALAAASVLWTFFGVYETAMHEWEKTVTAPIRVDLLLLAPVLWLVTMTAVGAMLLSIARPRRA
jgi:glucan phosphoethanolaminetransferase (alkaline phosphatase superfamily)